MQPVDPIFSEFDGAYSISTEFPDAATEEIPKDLYTAIDQGNERFFGDFESHLPLTYDALVSRCGKVRLLEGISESRSLGSFGETHHSYWWGAACGERLLLINIPRFSLDHPLRKVVDKKYLPCIPQQLHGLYKKMDGMSLSESFIKQGFDFPFAHNEWTDVYQYCRNLDIAFDINNKLMRDFPGKELRVIMRGSQSDLVITDFSSKDGRLYHVRNFEFDDYRQIENPGETLDRYFSNALQGFPENVSLS